MKKIDVSGWKKFKIEDVFMIKKPDARSEKYYEEGTVKDNIIDNLDFFV